MNYIIHNYYDVYNKNDAVFDPNAYSIGDDLAGGVCELRTALGFKEHKLQTRDLYSDSDEIHGIIYQDYPTGREDELRANIEKGIKNYLIIYESPMIKPDNYISENHVFFDKIFTWSDDLMTLGGKYRKIFWPVFFPEYIKFHDKTKHACMIACNKTSEHPHSMYQDRNTVIRYYNDQNLNGFDLYGHGWDNSLKCYKGTVKSKRQVMKDYKFVYCMENARYNGYITEKPWDVWFSGSVPIYYNNRYFPEHTYIPFDLFRNMDELYDFLYDKADEYYEMYLDQISKWLLSSESKLFNAKNFGYTIAMEMVGGKNV